MSDLIDRRAAIEKLRNNLTYMQVFGVDRSIVLINELPSAQPERKKGKWVHDRLCTTNGGTYGVRRCSICEAYYHDIDCGWNYCPNCGAEMEVSDGSD